MTSARSLDFTPFANAATAAFMLGNRQVANWDHIEECGRILKDLPSTVKDFEAMIDGHSKERIRSAAAAVRHRYTRTESLIGFIRHIAGRADRNKAQPTDFQLMHTFFSGLAT